VNDVDLKIEVEVNPTEDKDKVVKAVENIFGNIKFEVKPQDGKGLLIGTDEGLTGLAKFSDILRRDRIRDAARGVLFGGLKRELITFYLNKQVAYAGHISFSNPMGESPLGPIEVRIRCSDPAELIEWLAPKTVRR
jgi:predicted RNA binding protein with dsRBD fold (UPF0201 family)